MNTVAIIQARMTSTRLPGKVLAEVAGSPLLALVVERVRRATTLDSVAVATTVNATDDPVVAACAARGIPCIRGSEADVLDRYHQAAEEVNADVIVRITADCPLIDPEVIDRVVTVFRSGDLDYAANVMPATYPDGLDTEVFRRATLERAWREARLQSEREHVTLYIRNHPERFRLANVVHTEDLSGHRWTVDEPRDLELVRAIYHRLGTGLFGMADVVRLLRQEASLSNINAGIDRNEGLTRSLQQDVQIGENES